MKRINTELPGVYILEPDVRGDARGYFMETYAKETFHELGIADEFVQDNESFTARKGTLRGLHFQNEPAAQSKLVRVGRGAVWDVAVDLRRGSPHYLRWVGVELSCENKRMLYVPRGFAHAFLTLTEDVTFIYKVDALYSPEHDRTIRFDDPDIAVRWLADEPLLSDKDRGAPAFRDSDCSFVYRP